MGYRTYVKLVYKDGRVREFREVYIESTTNGFRISQYSDYRNEVFVPYDALNESECRKYNPGICAIATAVYLSEGNIEKLNILRNFRDNTMRKKKITNLMLEIYYRVSPSVAAYIRENEHRREVVSIYFIDPCVKLIQKKNQCENKNKTKCILYEGCVYFIYVMGLIYSWLSCKIERVMKICKNGTKLR